MPKIRRIFVVMVLLSAATAGMVMGARWTGGDTGSGTAIEQEKSAAQYTMVQSGAKEQQVIDSPNSYNWAIYTGVSALTGLYIMARILGARKRRKTTNLR